MTVVPLALGRPTAAPRPDAADTSDDALLAWLDAALALTGASSGAVVLFGGVAAEGVAPKRKAARGGSPHRAAPRVVAVGRAAAARRESTPLVHARYTAWARAAGARVAAALAGRDDAGLGIEAIGLDAAPRAAFAAAGVRWLWHLALRRSGRLEGWLVVALPDRRSPPPRVRGSIAALARLVFPAGSPAGAAATGGGRAGPSSSGDATARERLAELGQASQALHEAIAGLAGISELTSFLETLLREALRTAGTDSGAIVLLEGPAGHEVVHHAVVLDRGRVVPSAVKQARGIERLPLGDAGRRFVARVGASPDGWASKPTDSVYNDAFRAHFKASGVGSVFSVGLRVGSRLIGWIGAGYEKESEMRPDRLALLHLLADQMTMAVELTRLADSAKRTAIAQERAAAAQSRIDQLLASNRALSAASDTLAADPVVDAVLGYTLATMCEQLFGSVGVGSLWLCDPERGVQWRHLAYVEGGVTAGGASGFPGGGDEAPLEVAVAADGARGGLAQILQPADIPSARREHLERWGCRAAIVFRMALAGRPLGAFFVGIPAGSQDPPTEDMHFSSALVQQATLAIELTRLADAASSAAVVREREQAAQMRVGELAEANRALKRTLDLISDDIDIGDMLGRLLQVVAAQAECTFATLCLRDEDGGDFAAAAVCVDGEIGASDPRSPTGHLCPPRDSAVWPALVERRQAIVFERDGAGAVPLPWFDGLAARTLLAVPLIQRGEVIGCFTFRFDAARRFSAEQLELLQTLAHQATLSVQLERLARAAEVRSHRSATLAERARIARDLHDTLAQGLTGILMHLQAGERTTDPARARLHARHALEAARGALVDATRSVYSLRSLAAEPVELGVALKRVLRTTFAGSELAVEVDGDVDAPGLNEAAETELLRIAQEAATNALKHARAGRFDARLSASGGAIELVLADDGVGFDTAAPRAGFGLVGIAERAHRIGAALRIDSAPGAGTRIVVRLPARAPAG